MGLAFAVLALSMAAIVVAADPADVGGIGESFTVHDLACGLLEQDVWVEDGVRHVRDRVSASVVLSASPTHAGTGTIVANADVDTETGHATFYGSLEIRPRAVRRHSRHRDGASADAARARPIARGTLHDLAPELVNPHTAGPEPKTFRLSPSLRDDASRSGPGDRDSR